MLAIFLDQWELPKPLSGLPRTAHELVGKRLIIAKKTSNRWTESHHAGARQCRQVDHVIRLFLRGERQGVGQDQSTLGVGVENFAGLALHLADNVAGSLGVSAGAISRCRR